MEDRAEGSGAAVVISVSLILLLLVVGGGAGLYFFVARQQMSLVIQAERARLAEQQARMQAELARAEADAQVQAEIARANVQAAAASSAASADNRSSTADGDSIRVAVEAVLRAQEEAWNRGDIEAFMEHYWKSEELTFSSSGKTTRGWTATLDRYRERYPIPEKMGRLTLSGLEITPLGDSASLVLGQWQVERESEPLTGNFSLVLRKFDDRWQIVHDHTSRLID